MEKYEKKMKIWKCQLKFIFSTWYHHCYVSRILRYVYIVENSISEKCHISHVFVDLGILNSTSGDDSEGIWGQDYKRKITYVKPLVVLDSNRKSNVKLWRNLKLGAGGKPSTRLPPGTLVEISDFEMSISFEIYESWNFQLLSCWNLKVFKNFT